MWGKKKLSSNNSSDIGKPINIRAPKLPKLKPRLLIIAGLVSLISIGAYFGYQKFDQARVQKGACGGKTTSPLYAEAAKVLSPETQEQLGVVVKKIESYPNYNKEVNCLIPVVLYYSYIGDAEKARLNFNFLEPLYTSDSLVSDAYKTQTVGIYDIKFRVDNVEEINKEKAGSVLYF